MSTLVLILLTSVLTSVIGLTASVAWRPFATTRSTYHAAQHFALALAIVLPVSMLACLLCDTWLLVPLHLTHLRTLTFVVCVIATAAAAELAIQRFTSVTPVRPAFLLWTASHNAVLGMPLIAARNGADLSYALGMSLLAAAGFAGLLLAVVALYERLQQADVPAMFRQAPLLLVTAGIMALGFMGFTGLIQE